jgi:hypothetical protein
MDESRSVMKKTKFGLNSLFLALAGGNSLQQSPSFRRKIPPEILLYSPKKGKTL